jgi:hypothetical protein
MAKYDALARHLRRQRLTEFEMSFAEIERVLGDVLPKSAARPPWWANLADPGQLMVQQQAWFGAGYDAFLIAGRDRVRFRRV